MTPKQEAFCLAYVETGNASEAYRRSDLTPRKSAPGYYTYFLIDPHDDVIFYVGKGIRKRLSQHVAAVKAGRVDNPAKCQRIADILASGESVVEAIFSVHERPDAALMVERSCIERFRPSLTNIASGTVSERERAAMMARLALARMIPFEVWHANVRPDFLATLRDDPRAVYDLIRQDFLEAADGS